MSVNSLQGKSIHILVAIMLLSIGLHWTIWDKDIAGIHAWRQTQTMTVVENFASESMNILEPRINCRGSGDGIFRMEFPLMQWIFAWFYQIFGHKLIIARILVWIISILGTIGFYKLIREYKQTETTSVIGAWCFSWSPILFYYSVNPLPDNLALSLAVWSLVFLKRFQQNRRRWDLTCFSIFLGIATAVKLPFILFGAGLIPILISVLRTDKLWTVLTTSLIVGVIMIPALSWYAWVIPQWNNAGIISGIGAEGGFDKQAALKTLWGTTHSMLPELLINYGSVPFFLFGGYQYIQRANKLAQFKIELSILFFVLAYYFYEINMIGLVHDYYLFPFLPLIFLIVAFGAKKMLANNHGIVHYFGILALLILPLTAFLRTTGRWIPSKMEMAILSNKQELSRLIPQDALIVVGNDPSMHIILYHLNKKGWTFEQNWLNAEELKDHIHHGAKYIYLNTEHFENNVEIQSLLEKSIFRKDGISVYPLKQVIDL
jgi:4-amino-4-deoxy-L-arabinose transferase-like glycosyltransferase